MGLKTINQTFFFPPRISRDQGCVCCKLTPYFLCLSKADPTLKLLDMIFLLACAHYDYIPCSYAMLTPPLCVHSAIKIDNFLKNCYTRIASVQEPVHRIRIQIFLWVWIQTMVGVRIHCSTNVGPYYSDLTEIKKPSLGDPEVTANIYSKLRNLPNTDTQKYSTDLR